MSNPTFEPFATTVPGYPRVGPRRVYKSLLEGFWSGRMTDEEFESAAARLRAERLRTQVEHGLDLVPSGDFSLYDHVLDASVQYGCIPERFGWDGSEVGHRLYFAIARGADGVAPLEMTKWFDTNYHYLVPELPEEFRLDQRRALEPLRFARSVVGERAKPYLLGPFTFLRLARLSGPELARRLDELVPLVGQVVEALTAEGARLIQVDEPALVQDQTEEDLAAFRRAYLELALQGPICIQTYYGHVSDRLGTLFELPIAGIGLDFVRDRGRNREALRTGFPKDKLLIAGVVDGRNVWRSDLDACRDLVEELATQVDPTRLLLSASCPMWHLPETVRAETKLSPTFAAALSFARERLVELALLSKAMRDGTEGVQEDWDAMRAALRAWRADDRRFDAEVQARVASLSDRDAQREPYPVRRALQAEKLRLPVLPTTTIGSFPQTAELRKARAKRDEDPAAYERCIREEIERVIRLQEEIGLDVLVHGEPERNDMVQFFGDQMKGFATTEEGWVQSYGSRCVRPPILFGDVRRLGPMSVREIRYAQSLTSKPVKGMLTGPITILQWSFVRGDVPRSTVSFQIALAIRDEVRDLEEAGVRIVQIDEAAFREGLPLRRADWPDYFSWTIRSFRYATGGARPTTQIHTHMCYSEFGDIIEEIAAMDADVISIEDSRSNGALLATLSQYRYPQQIGPGVYDIHSPNVPSVEFIEGRIRSTLACLPAEQVWVNPDCGLKTRRYEEVVPSLNNMVQATMRVRLSWAASATPGHGPDGGSG